jgi:hypothetical protein
MIDSTISVFRLILIVEYTYQIYEPAEIGVLAGFIYFFHFMIFIEFTLRGYSNKDPKKYFLSANGMVDLLSNLPFLILRPIISPFDLPYTYDLAIWFTKIFTYLQILKFDVLSFHFIVKILNILYF